MFSLLNSIDNTLRIFFSQLTETLGFTGYLGLFVGVEVLFVLLFVIKSAFSYEKRLKRSLKNLNNWLFENKQVNENNITEFNRLIKKGPKRLVYYWQQYILYREDNPSAYMNEQNLIEKPLKTSSYQSNIKNLSVLTWVWSIVAAVFGIASQTNLTLSLQNLAVGLIFSVIVAIIGTAAIIILRARRVVNLDDIYHLYHYFARFSDNACAELTPFIDFDLLFTPKEIEKGNAHLREYYETRARKAREELEKASKENNQTTQYNFEDLGVDGSLLLNRAMSESEKYITKKRDTIAEISRIEAQKDALKRNYETVQMDLQRKIQATKENIAKLIEQQAATSSRVEVGLLRTQQEKEVAKQATLQKDYDKEESRYVTAKKELEAEVEKLSKLIDEGLDEATKGMASEYQSFFAKVMKTAYTLADKRVREEKDAIKNEADKNEEELINVQTQIKRLKDENDTLRAMLEAQNGQDTTTNDGHYDENGNYIYADGSYHDAQGLFHDVDGKIYNMNGELVSKEENPEEVKLREQEQIKQEQINQFGAFVSSDNETVFEPKVEPYIPEEEENAPVVEPYIPDEEEKVEPKVEPYVPEEEEKPEEVDPFAMIEEPEEAPVEEKEEVKENKRGRGRPRKEETKAEEAAPVAKRGRPRKVVEPAPAEAPAKRPGRPRKEEPKAEPAKRPGRPRKEEPKAEPAKRPGRPKKVQAEPVKRPGRPRKEEPKVEPAKKPGRPRKEEVKAEPVKKAGRPKKVQTEPVKKPGRPKKVQAEAPAEKKTRGRPRKVADKTKEPEEPAKRKPGRPRKDEKNDEMSISQMNDMINEISKELNSSQNKIDEVLNASFNDEKESLIKQADALKKQIEKAKKNGMSDKEVASMNKKLEELIKKMASLNG